VLVLDDEPAFERSFWCGTCPFLFRRLKGARQTLSLEPQSWEDLRERLARRLTEPDGAVVEAFAALLPEDDYLPLLLQVEPRLVVPGQDGDYFSHEQVATWGIDGFWGLPEYPHTPYYRTFETAVGDDAHLYEFVVPMVPPTWNERDRVEEYAQQMRRGVVPTAVAVSTLDLCRPATDSQSTDYYEHWGLTHFLLDGHHKLEAAASAGQPVRLLALLALGESSARARDHRELARLRAQHRRSRAAS
jgi:hypothetical protein